VLLSAHNLLLDLVLWNGIPLGLAVFAGLLLWLRTCQVRSKTEPARLLLLAIAILVVHAMFEYPLTYAYFLLPFGLLAGALGQRVNLAVVLQPRRWLTLTLLVCGLLGAGMTVRDYFRVEHSYRQLLFEKARIQLDDDRAPPDVLALTSLRDLIVYARMEPSAGMSGAQLDWMQRVMRAHPGAHGFAKLASALAINGRAAEAQHWVDQLCLIFLPAQCQIQAEAWRAAAKDSPELRAVQWPR
jgi:hypothetical protein